MSFDFTCGFCGTTLEAEEDWIGQEAECPACQNIFIVSKLIASGNGDSVSISHKERIKMLAKQHKKMLILAGILILFIILISITSAIIHKYIIEESWNG